MTSYTLHQFSVSRDGGIGSDDMLVMKPKERKKHDRFNGMSEAEVIQRTIPDHLCDNLDIVIVSCKFRTVQLC